MKLYTLIENTTCDERLACEHGLSLYIETERHRILFDAGQSPAFAENAQKMGIDLSKVDIAVLSHGHYDHGGGMLHFLARNQTAPVYVSRYAFEPHFNALGRDIGLEDALRRSGRLVRVGEELRIDEELSLFSCNAREKPHDMLTCGLSTLKDGVQVPEDFRHEQYLLIREGQRRILVSGCSHKGILNIAGWFAPDVLIGGFHFMKLDTHGQDADFLRTAASRLLSCPTRYYTGHCTGQAQYELLKSCMGDRLSCLTTGSVWEILD